MDHIRAKSVAENPLTEDNGGKPGLQKTASGISSFLFYANQTINLMEDRQSEPRITIDIMENGPLIVKGLKELKAPDGSTIETKESVALCRCGESANKPYCDGSHKRNGFSGTRESERSLRASRAYRGEQITIHDNRTICAHAAYCVDDLKSVFQSDARPWINPDGASTEEVIALVRRCPSGALSYELNGQKYDNFDHTEHIAISAGGPYTVCGGIHLETTDELQPPSPEHYTLCRCGASKNKPYCDGSHHNLAEDWDR